MAADLDAPRPNYRFCWECSRQLRGNSFELKTIDGVERVLHKLCAQMIEDGQRDLIPEGDEHG